MFKSAWQRLQDRGGKNTSRNPIVSNSGVFSFPLHDGQDVSRNEAIFPPMMITIMTSQISRNRPASISSPERKKM